MKKILLIILLIVGCATAQVKDSSFKDKAHDEAKLYSECLADFSNSMIPSQETPENIANGAIGQCEPFFLAAWQSYMEDAKTKISPNNYWMIDKAFGPTQYDQEIAKSKRAIIAKVLRERNPSTR
jgi:hypothetical protein